MEKKHMYIIYACNEGTLFISYGKNQVSVSWILSSEGCLNPWPPRGTRGKRSPAGGRHESLPGHLSSSPRGKEKSTRECFPPRVQSRTTRHRFYTQSILTSKNQPNLSLVSAPPSYELPSCYEWQPC
jgi:hypothetical protein